MKWTDEISSPCEEADSKINIEPLSAFAGNPGEIECHPVML